MGARKFPQRETDEQADKVKRDEKLKESGFQVPKHIVCILKMLISISPGVLKLLQKY